MRCAGRQRPLDDLFDTLGLRRVIYPESLRGVISDGHVLAMTENGDGPVGQMELQVPYGLTIGYVNLFTVARRYRGLGFGRAIHEYAVRYFRSWEADTIELHVSPSNDPALTFYRRMGYRYVRSEGALWRMAKDL